MKYFITSFAFLVLVFCFFAIDAQAQSPLDGFNPDLGVAQAIAIQRDGKILIGGAFGIVRLEEDGTLDREFRADANGAVLAIAVQADDQILAGGSFTRIGGLPRNKVARLDTTGRADASFNPNPNNGSIHDFSNINSIAVQSDNQILIAGHFTRIGADVRRHIARLRTDGSLDRDFNPNPDSTVFTITVQSDRRILVGGAFTQIGMASRKRIARLNPTNGLVDPTDRFDADIQDGFVTAIAVQSDSRVLVGGNFTKIGTRSRVGVLSRRNLARLDADTGEPDLMFDPNRKTHVIGWVHSIALQSDGKLLVGSDALGARTPRMIARLDATTGLPEAFNPDPNGSVYSVALRDDGKVLVGGNFNSFGRGLSSVRRNGFALLSNDTVAVSTIEVTSTSVIMRRNGSAPQLTRETMEFSIDNGVSYNFLGEAVPTASGYSLTGIHLPTERTILVRSRGYFRSGVHNGSETMVEQVQSACVLPATSTNLIRNPSFELTPCATPCNQDQDFLPSDWLRLTGTPDTFSEDGSYGIPPDNNGNFTGVVARDPIRWVAGASDFREIFGQDLICPLIPGQEYTLTAYLHQAVRSEYANPGTYLIELWDSVNPDADKIEVGRLMPFATSSTEWQSATLLFTAPPGAATHRVLAFRPVGLDGPTPRTYPGIDNVVLIPGSSIGARANVHSMNE